MTSTKNFVKTSLCALFLVGAVSTAPMAAHASTKKADGGPIYVDFKNIVVPIIKENGRTSIVAFSVMAEVNDENAKTVVTSHLPRLRDAFIRSLYGNLDGTAYKHKNGQLNIEQIKTRLMQTAKFVLKNQDEGTIKDILFQNVAHQTY